MKFVYFYLIILLIGIYSPTTAQITFSDKQFQDALASAKKEKKNLFLDFYADWCEPCKIMEKEVFALPEVGDYFNERFICLKINVETPENKEIVQKYQVNALPTMLFINNKGEVLRTLNGATAPANFVHEAMVAAGDALSFEQLYTKLKKDKKNLELRQEFLAQAPSFINTQQGYEREKWSTRIEAIFDEYLQTKTIANMANPDDFILLTMFHGKKTKNDPIFDALVANYPLYAEKVGKAQVNKYLVGLFNSYIISLCREGKAEYKQELERVNGDLKIIYGNIPFGKLTSFEAISLLADGYYNLFRKNTDIFFEKMNKYFEGAEGVTTANNYTMPVEDLFSLYQGEIPESAYPKVIPWLEKALTFPQMSPQVRTRVLCILGDCYKKTDNAVKAKQCFNQAFVTSASIEDKAMMLRLQQMIQSRLNSL